MFLVLTLNDSVAPKQAEYCDESTLRVTLGELLGKEEEEEEEVDEEEDEDELNDEDVTDEDEDEDEDAVLAVWDALVIYKLDGTVND